MPTSISPQEFVAKWRQSTLKESASKQEYFIDICHLVDHPTPVEGDPTGIAFGFEKEAEKGEGKSGFADFWKKGYFGWEAKSKGGDLDKAYRQLLQYREALDNPPLLVVSDFEKIVIQTNFTNSVKQVVTLTLNDLLTPRGLENLKNVFYNFNAFKSKHTPEQVTQKAAEEFGRLAESLRKWGIPPQPAAHFLIRILFCLFAEDVGLLPNKLFSRMVKKTWMRPAELSVQLRDLFGKMAKGGWFGADEILHINGGLFDDDTVFDLDSDAINALGKISDLDWSSIEPSIIGTLFERSLDPSKRSQIGAHYTSKDDILLIVEPVLMAPLRKRWAEVEKEAREVAAERDAMKGSQSVKRKALTNKIRVLLMNFDGDLRRLRVLDPACGSGNFLYVALRQLLDLEKRVITLSSELGVGQFAPEIGPEQLFGIEINPYAHELAHATVWIGYIQWLRENGYGRPSEPILKRLDNIKEMDAILAYNPQGEAIEPEWPGADVIIGNPPFLGGNKIRQGLGGGYVDDLFDLYDGRVPATADLVCYWFEKARAMIQAARVKRAGLLATQGIRGGSNRKVLDRVKESGDIFFAYSDREWTLNGAAVHVSMVGFDNGVEKTRRLNDAAVSEVNSNLTAAADTTLVVPLEENAGIAFRGNQKGGPFDIPESKAKAMLSAPNPNKKSNADVVKPCINGLDITRRPRKVWIIDFGIDMSREEAALYEMPFEYVKSNVYPIRKRNNRKRYRDKWWIHVEARPSMRSAIARIDRCIVTPHVSKYRVFTFIDTTCLPDHELIVIARDDDYFFGVLHSKVHELWARGMGTQLREVESGFRYTPTTTFETFPFPWPPGKEPKKDPRVKCIAEAARELDKERNAWLNPPDCSEEELQKRTLTNLYNAKPEWLYIAHRRLDEAVLDAYGWPHDLSDDEILARLLELNLQRAKANGPKNENA